MNLVGIYTLTTTSAVVGISGMPKRVYFANNISGGGGAASTKLYNGTSTSGDLLAQVDGTTSKMSTNWIVTDAGIRFDKGLYVSTDANTAGGVIVYEEEF